ncbi:lactonase family protein [Flavihumibacter sp. UBA7668]|uniref:lactonase family protein n=1 Tax=Flavihumibacter sp. UBA7668 TaxID=1946542 RepID=UPI0025C150C8|nr:beta-propeller fold lactonase family protein [Flavihumibacter sp. UBA7668]
MLFVTGSYTEENSPAKKAIGEGLNLYIFFPEPPFLRLVQQVYLRNPSYPVWIKEHKQLIVAEEVMSGEKPILASYLLNQEELVFREQLVLPGSSPCHTALVGDDLVVANYSSSDVSIVDFNDGTFSGKDVITYTHDGKGFNPDRQEAAHPHMIYTIDENSFWVPDLGMDCIFTYERDEQLQRFERKVTKTIQLPPGTGPRHLLSLQQHTYLVVLGELRGELFLYKKQGYSYKRMHSLLLLKEDSASAAAIITNPSETFIYVSERDSNSIYQIEIKDDQLRPVNTIHCKGETPRDISIDPSENWLLAANQDSNTITVFSIRQSDGHLFFEHTIAVGSPVCITWLYS